MPDYQKAKIYKLWSPQGEEDEIYIGSTCDELRKRKNNHKSQRNCNSKILFEKYTDVRIEVIEEYPCNSKRELEKKEGEHIRNNKCLNKYVAGRTTTERYEDNKEKIAEKLKEYYGKNKEKILEKQKEHYQNNKEITNEYQKEYRKNNKEAIAEKKKKYYENNKKLILEKKKEYYKNNKK